MSATLKVYCSNIGQYIPIHGGETLSGLLAAEPLKTALAGSRFICARVNNKTEPLQYQLFAPKMVEFHDVTTGSGGRVYVRSLCMMLYRALREVAPGTRLRIEHSISGGYFCRLSDSQGNIQPVDTAIAGKLLAVMRRLQQADIPFERKERLTRDIIGKFRAEGLDDKVRLLGSIHELYTTYYRLDGVIDSYYGALAPSTGIIDVFDIIPHNDGFLLMPFDKKDPSRPAAYVPQHKMFRAFDENLRFNDIVGVRDVGELNDAVAQGRSSLLINVAEDRKSVV